MRNRGGGGLRETSCEQGLSCPQTQLPLAFVIYISVLVCLILLVWHLWWLQFNASMVSICSYSSWNWLQWTTNKLNSWWSNVKRLLVNPETQRLLAVQDRHWLNTCAPQRLLVKSPYFRRFPCFVDVYQCLVVESPHFCCWSLQRNSWFNHIQPQWPGKASFFPMFAALVPQNVVSKVTNDSLPHCYEFNHHAHCLKRIHSYRC